MKKRIAALMIGKPGKFRDSLQVLLKAIPQIEKVNQADNVFAAAGRGTKHRLALVLLDSSGFDGEWLRVLDQIKAEWPQARCVVLVENEAELPAAKAAGVDKVLLKGYPAEKLLETLEQVLLNYKEEH